MNRLLLLTNVLLLFIHASCEEETCVVEQEKKEGGSVVKTINIGNDGTSLTPSSIIVIENFLPEDFIQTTFQNITNDQEWRTVIPDHQKKLEEFQQTKNKNSDDNDDESTKRLLKAVQMNDGGFPGTRTDLTKDYEAALKAKIDTLDLESMLGLSNNLEKRWSSTDSFFGNVCYHPSSLGISQRAPHTDFGLIDRKSATVAIVHYLNPTFQGTGGTSFYKEKISQGSRFFYSDCKRLREKAKEMGLKPGTTTYMEAISCHCRINNVNCSSYIWYARKLPEAKYTNDSTSHYELMLHVPYKFNTAVIYATQQLHSAYIDDDTLGKLTCDAKEGRVTGNVFLV